MVAIAYLLDLSPTGINFSESNATCAFMTIEEAEAYMLSIRDGHVEAFICEYDIETPENDLPVGDLKLVEWEKWNGDITVSYSSSTGTWFPTALAKFFGLAWG